MKSIVVATDLSHRSDRAALRGALVAHASGAELHLLHVIDEDQPRALIEAARGAADAHLAEQSRSIAAVNGIECRTKVIVGGTFVAIIRTAKDLDADLLLIGPHRRSLLKDIFVGTTAERAIRTSSMPVLMVNAEEIAPYGRVLVAVDLSAPSATAIRALAKLELAKGASISVFHAFEVTETSLIQRPTIPADEVERRLPFVQAAADRALAEFLVGLPIEGERRIAQLVDASVPETIHSVAAGWAADLIVVGTRGRTGLPRLYFGSTALGVLRSAKIDVLTVPPGAA